MRKTIRMSMLLTAAALLTESVFAVTGIWTGRGVNGNWNNPENWQDGIVPGKYTDEGGVERGQTGDTANFGEIVPGGQTTINLSSLYSVKNVNINGENAPAYVFGSERTASQVLTIEGNGKFTVYESNSSTQTVTQLGVQVSSGGSVTFDNNSPGVLAFGDTQKGKGYSYPGANVIFTGKGPVCISGRAAFDQVSGIYFYGTGKVFYHDTGSPGSVSRYNTPYFGKSDQETCDVEVDNFIFGMGGSWTWTKQFAFVAKRTHLTGAGVLTIHYPYNAPSHTPQTVMLYPNSTTICDIGIDARGGQPAKDLLICGTSDPNGGTIYLNSTNRMTGCLRLMDAVTCCARMIGNKGVTAENSSIPLGDQIIFEGYWTGVWNTSKKEATSYTANSSYPRTATLKYTGDKASSTDRDFVVSNMWSATARRVSTNTFANAGGGKFTLNSVFKSATNELTGLKRMYSDTAAIRLQAETADLDFNGSFQAGNTWHVFFAGPNVVSVNLSQPNVRGNLVLESGTLNIPSPSTFANVDRYQFAGGRLNFTSGGFNSSIRGEVLRGANEVTLGIGSKLAISGIGTTLPAGATLNFTTGSGSIVKFSGLSSVDLPLTFTLNGMPAMVDADGVLVDRSVRWKSAVSGNWTDSAKWTINAAPKDTDAVYICANGPDYTVSSTGAARSHRGQITLSNDNPGSKATLSGSFNFQDGSSFDIEKGGRWLSTSGESWWNSKTNSIIMRDGEIDFRGTATLHLTNMNVNGTARQNYHAYTVFGKGLTSFSENAVIDIYASSAERSPYLVVCPEKAGEVARLRFADDIRIDANYDHMCCVLGNGVSGATSVLDFELTPGRELTSRVSSSVGGWRVGTIAGTGIINVRSGNLRVSNAGLQLGCPYDITIKASENEGYCPTGIVNQTGGTVFGGSYQTAYSVQVTGIIIGAGQYTTAAGNSFTGFYNLSGGAFNQTVGLFVVGAGPRSTGFFDMTGGTFSYAPSYTHSDGGGTDSYTHPMLVGFGGGKGEFTIGGGTGSVSQGLYVGGALATDIGLTGKSYHYNFSYSPCGTKAAEGIFSITGGTFTVAKDVYLGVDGKGVFEVGGGTFKCANMVFSNNVASVLRFLPTENCAADWNVDVTNRLVITDGAKLEIDVRRVRNLGAKWLKVIGAREVEGEFEDAVPTVISDGASEKVRSTFAGGDVHYEHNGEKGVWYRLASASFTIYFR